MPTSLEAIAEGNAEASVSEEPGAVIPHARPVLSEAEGIRAGGGRATALPTATARHTEASKVGRDLRAHIEDNLKLQLVVTAERGRKESPRSATGLTNHHGNDARTARTQSALV